MNDPFGRNSQALTDALLQLDRAISLAESNVAVARQLGLPEAAELERRLPLLTLNARRFLASVPDFNQPQRWGEARRLLDQASAFQPLFAPYLMLGSRVAAAKQAQVDYERRQREDAERDRRLRLRHDADRKMVEARGRLSTLRQAVADMRLQRGPGFDDHAWRESVQSLASILAAQETRIAAAAANARDTDFDQAQVQLDQALGELQAGLDLARRARATAERASRQTQLGGVTRPMPALADVEAAQPRLVSPSDTARPVATPRTVPFQTLSLIETRGGIMFRLAARPTVVGRGLESPAAPDEIYVNLSLACDPGEAEYLGVSRRHAEFERQPAGFMVRDLGSTNGTRIRHLGQSTWETLPPNQWLLLREGDSVRFGLLECTISLS